MAIVVLAIVIDSALYNNKVHAGVSVSGVSLSGMTKDEASPPSMPTCRSAGRSHHPHEQQARPGPLSHQCRREGRRRRPPCRQPWPLRETATSSATSGIASSSTSAQ